MDHGGQVRLQLLHLEDDGGHDDGDGGDGGDGSIT